MLYQIFIFILCTVYVNGAFEGESCVKDGSNGVCVYIKNCQTAQKDLREGKRPQICSFDNLDAIVCCLDKSSTTPATPVITTVSPGSTTTEYVPPVYDYVDVSDRKDGCEPIPATMTSAKTGQKAWDKCIEYQEQLIYPCVKGVALSGEKGRANRCGHTTDQLIIGGQDAEFNEYPHMVLLGYGDNLATLKWLCGGSLISDRFILTAGHCIADRDAGPVTYAVVGALRRNDTDNEENRYKIKNIIKNPDYSPPRKYHDIALLETDRQVKLSQFVVPACIHVGEDVKDDRAAATGWGLTQYMGGTTADVLQKVVLTKFTSEECSLTYGKNRLMREGVVAATQMCYGDKDKSKDTCQGDSGGPLQIHNKKISCMYTIIGVTSFGKACGFIGQPGIYTRVIHYLPWIESIVWP